MLEQELTLFGGWAKALTPQPIGFGVDKPSVSLSASIFTRSQWDWDEDKSITWGVLHTPEIRIERDETPTLIIEITKSSVTQENTHKDLMNLFNIQPEVKETITTLDPNIKWVEISDSDGNSRMVISPWSHTIENTWANLAFFRFFELWEKGTSEDLRRAVEAMPSLQKSFAGMIGGQNDLNGKLNTRPLTKLPSGEWKLKDKSLLYPRIRRLPDEGIKNARTLAKRMRTQRMMATTKDVNALLTIAKTLEISLTRRDRDVIIQCPSREIITPEIRGAIRKYKDELLKILPLYQVDEKEIRRDRVIQSVNANPVVQATMHIFNATINDIRIS